MRLLVNEFCEKDFSKLQVQNFEKSFSLLSNRGIGVSKRLINALDILRKEVGGHSFDNPSLDLVLIEQVQTGRNHVAATKTRGSLRTYR